jgi:predicted DNA-binding transcriptional regulator AlpA
MKPGPRPVVNEYLLSIQDCMAKTKISRTKLDELVKAGQFPQPRRIAGSSLQRWRGQDVDAWIKELPMALAG